MAKFTNKVFLITGAGSGIGRATAMKVSFLGGTLALTDINPTSLAETLTLCDTAWNIDHRPHFIRDFDVGSTEKCNEFVEEVVKEFGRLDRVFNCAGINPTALPTASITDEYWDKMISTNLKGLFNITRASIPHLKSGACFVNVSSIAGLGATSGFAVYCATKYGIIGFSKCMALELGPRGIRTNVVAPGYIDTPTNAGVVKGAEAVKEMEGAISLGRFGTAEEVADVVVFLMGEESKYMNGSVVEVHGGVK